jgi:DNA-binding transcriptional ArsR family regulator
MVRRRRRWTRPRPSWTCCPRRRDCTCIWLLAYGDHDVGWLAEQVGATVAAVSQQLGKLRLAGLVSAQRVVRQQIYTADDPHILLLVDQVVAHGAHVAHVAHGAPTAASGRTTPASQHGGGQPRGPKPKPPSGPDRYPSALAVRPRRC